MSVKLGDLEQHAGEDFQTAFCKTYGCKLSDYEQVCFKKNLFFHARLCRWLFAGDNQEFFREDFELLRELATVSCPDTFRYEVNRFYGRNVREKRFLRRVLKIRLSGRKIRTMGAKLLKNNPSSIPLFQAYAHSSVTS